MRFSIVPLDIIMHHTYSNDMKKILIVACIAACTIPTVAKEYWSIDPGARSITWKIQPGEIHGDHLEMSGKRVSAVVRYSVDSAGSLTVNKNVVWPMLRTIPNDTHGSLIRSFSRNSLEDVKIDGLPVREQVTSASFDGTLRFRSILSPYNYSGVLGVGPEFSTEGAPTLEAERVVFPSTENPAVIETLTFTNISDAPVNVELPEVTETLVTDPSGGVNGSYTLSLKTRGGGTRTLAPGETMKYSTVIQGAKRGEEIQDINPDDELAARRNLVRQLTDNLALETPDTAVNCMFALSKIRACESIYATKNGPMHGPGGERYYAAIWANDQPEYTGPYFPFTGYDYADESAINAMRLFGRYMTGEYKPIPCSIVAEGDHIWNGAGDRGDAAMLAYGAGRYALAKADPQQAAELWPIIQWCLEYCRRNLNEDGVVRSDKDELEGRFPAGEANLYTSSLYYDALLSAAFLADELHKDKKTARTYRRQASEIRKAIDRYFPALVQGYDTYAYYKGNDILRSWICIPLSMGIDEKAAGTLDALFSSGMWTENGLLTQYGDNTYWDRSALTALRAGYTVGETDRTTNFLRKFSRTRLLGEHVPYAIEAWPEGGKRHLAAESALYGRIFTEGVFGIRPTGFGSFNLRPRLPAGWNSMAMRHIRAFGGDFSVEISRLKDSRIRVTVTDGNREVVSRIIQDGNSIDVKL